MEYAEFTEVGNHVKEAIPHATANGLASLDLAQAGFLAPLDILDDTRYFDSATLIAGIGAEWMIESVYFKPYSYCRWIHSSIDGLIQIMSENGLTPRDITSIRVETFGKAAVGLNNQKAPSSLEAALFSIPFCLGVVAVHGPELLVPMTDGALLDDKDVLTMASRVEVVLDDELDSQFPRAVPSRLRVTCGEAVYTQTVSAPLGEPQNPMSWDALFEKFHQLASSEIALHQEVRLRQALNALKNGDLTPLLAELVQPAAPREPEWRRRYFFPAWTDVTTAIPRGSSSSAVVSRYGGGKQ